MDVDAAVVINHLLAEIAEKAKTVAVLRAQLAAVSAERDAQRAALVPPGGTPTSG